MTLPRKARVPKSPPFHLEVVYASEPALSSHISAYGNRGCARANLQRGEDGGDCFKHRRRVGLDVAVEALRDALRQRKTTPAKVMQAATLDRVANVARPYVEALT